VRVIKQAKESVPDRKCCGWFTTELL